MRPIAIGLCAFGGKKCMHDEGAVAVIDRLLTIPATRVALCAAGVRYGFAHTCVVAATTDTADHYGGRVAQSIPRLLSAWAIRGAVAGVMVDHSAPSAAVLGVAIIRPKAVS